MDRAGEITGIMPLPNLIEIVPLSKPVSAEITVPGSKSITNRALVLAALADGETTLEGALWSEDTQVMVDCLQKLGFPVKVAPDPSEYCNRLITVQGMGGKIPRAGTEAKPLELFVGNAGTAARFLAALVCLGQGTYRLHGVPRMHERPQAALFVALRQLGYRVDSPNNKLPANIYGTGTRAGKCTVTIEESSQFASALLMCATRGGWQVEVVGENSEESPYVAITAKLIKSFPSGGGNFEIEPDASSGSYFLAAASFVEPWEFLEYSPQYGIEVPTMLFRPVTVAHWPSSGWQIDERFPRALELSRMELNVDMEGVLGDQIDKIDKEFLRFVLKGEISRKRDLGDSIMMAIVLAPTSEKTLRFVDLGRLRLQECERVAALRTELTKCGAKVEEAGDTLTVFPSMGNLHGAEIETYDDHRMAMCFSILGLKVPGIKIKNPACVKKTFPNFFQKLAAPPPGGLGATILDAKSGRKLELNELFAD
jgi:3-phosphoshikimate 1-carboxyvinyltransferase